MSSRATIRTTTMMMMMMMMMRTIRIDTVIFIIAIVIVIIWQMQIRYWKRVQMEFANAGYIRYTIGEHTQNWGRNNKYLLSLALVFVIVIGLVVSFPVIIMIMIHIVSIDFDVVG